MVDGWLSGRRAICEYCGVKDWRTIQAYCKVGLPVQRRPGGRPTALKRELDVWLDKYNKNKAINTTT